MFVAMMLLVDGAVGQCLFFFHFGLSTALCALGHMFSCLRPAAGSRLSRRRCARRWILHWPSALRSSGAPSMPLGRVSWCVADNGPSAGLDQDRMKGRDAFVDEERFLCISHEGRFL